MWIVAKTKNKQLNTFIKNISRKEQKCFKFYCPKIEYYRYFGSKKQRLEKSALENYIFCYHKKFNEKAFINSFRFTRGLDYFLKGAYQDQNEIIEFIKYCKLFENEQGYLNQNFFKNIITKRAKFISGPFTNMIFEILEKQKNKLKILVGDIVTTISDKANHLYRPV